MSLPVVLTIILAISGSFMGLMSMAYVWLPARRFYPEPEKRLQRSEFITRMALIAVFSTAITYGLILGLGTYIIDARPTTWWRALYRSVAILMLYDLMYYFLHRYPFHRWNVLMRIHAIHHQALRPSPWLSLLLHPIENIAGLGLFIFTVWLLGPVDLTTFSVCFLAYSCLNIVNHAGIHLPVPFLGMLARKHNLHHKHMKAGNYSTLSPLPDLLFGTAE